LDLAICVRNLPTEKAAEVGRFASDCGFNEVFVPDGSTSGQTDDAGRLTGRDPWTWLASFFTATEDLRATLGVAATPMYHRLVLPVKASTLFELSGGRFSLGLGVSHPEQTARFGATFPDHPVGYMRAWIRELRDRSDSGMAYGCGWKVLIAALGAHMVELGAAEADGLILNWLTPQAAAASVGRARQVGAGGPPPRVVLYVRVFTEAAALSDARAYDALTNYHRNFVAQGLRTPEEIAAGTILPRGDLGAARARLEQYRSAGLDAVCLYPAAFEAEDRRALEALAR
jgi:alkanesulfonate monooxygenase SsuD/methylene tetrahydromethanopterin reductase-like flavin-dependent oxidoreductase (luciferase family)